MNQYVLTYGIACIEIKQNYSEVIQSISDVSTDKGVAQRIVDTCNAQELSPEHLADVIDDLVNA